MSLKRKIMIGYMGMGLLPFLFIPSSCIADATHISWFIVCTGIGICAYSAHKKSELKRLGKVEVIASALLSVLLLLMLSLSEILNSPLFDIDRLREFYPAAIARILQVWEYAFYLPVLFLGIFICVYYTVSLMLQEKVCQRKNLQDSNNVFMKCFFLISGMSVLFLFSTYPGVWIQADVSWVWNLVTNQNWGDWHPFGYLLFVHLCTIFLQNTFVINIIQTIIWLIINWRILYNLKMSGIQGMKTYTIMLLLSVTPFVYLEVMYKDTVFSMGMLLLVSELSGMIKREYISWKETILIAVITLFVTLTRHAGWVPAILSLAVAIIYFACRKKYHLAWKAGIICTVQVAGYLIVYSLLFNIMNVERNPDYVTFSPPMTMIGAAVNAGVHFDEEDQAALEKVMPLQEWGECYNKYWVDDISRTWGKIGERIYLVDQLIENEQYGKKLLEINLKLAWRYPGIYCRALFDMNSILWEMGEPIDADDMSLCTVPKDENITYLALFRITDIWSNMLESLPLSHALFWRGGISLFCIIFAAVIFLLKGSEKYILALLPIGIYDCLLVLTVPAQDPRFVLPTIECAIFICAFLVGNRCKDSPI